MSIRNESFYATGLFFIPVIILCGLISRENKKVFFKSINSISIAFNGLFIQPNYGRGTFFAIWVERV
jgi:hypothetical protein